MSSLNNIPFFADHDNEVVDYLIAQQTNNQLNINVMALAWAIRKEDGKVEVKTDKIKERYFVDSFGGQREIIKYHTKKVYAMSMKKALKKAWNIVKTSKIVSRFETINIKTTDTSIELTAPYNQNLIAKYKKAGCNWNADKKVWYFSFTSSKLFEKRKSIMCEIIAIVGGW